MQTLKQVLLVLCISLVLSKLEDPKKNRISHCQIYYDKTKESKCKVCESGYHKEEDGTCSYGDCMFGPKKIQNCVVCDSQNDPYKCLSCETGFTVSPTQNKCIEGDCQTGKFKVDHCKSCHTLHTERCGECEPGYRGEFCTELKCHKYNKNCLDCDGLNSKKCAKCVKGFQTDDEEGCVQGDCVTKDQFCDVCTTNGKECQYCKPGYHLVDGKCVAGDCKNGKEAIANCETCKTINQMECAVCKQEFVLNSEGKCDANDCKKDIPSCKICSNKILGYCDICNPGYTLTALGKCDEGDCKSKDYAVANCVECNEKNQDTCVRCDKKYHLIPDENVCEENDCSTGQLILTGCNQCNYNPYEFDSGWGLKPTTPRCQACGNTFKLGRFGFNCINNIKSFSSFLKTNISFLAFILAALF